MLAAVLLAGTALPAQAATPGWRQVFSKHYGAAGNYPQFSAVVALSAKNAWALGGTNVGGGTLGAPVAEHWNGKAWSRFATPKGVTDHIAAASAPAASDIWAVTQFGGYVLHWNGSAWSVAKRLPVPKGASIPPQLTGVVALSAKNVWAFGSSGFTLGWGTWHYNGQAWSQWHGNAADITDGSAVSRTNIWAIGGTNAPQNAIVHYTGTWKLVNTGSVLSGLQFEGIHAFSATNVWASAVTVSKGDQSWLVHYNNHAWAKFKMPWSVNVLSGHIVSDGHGGLWVSAIVPGTTTTRYYEVHRTANGAWSRTRVSAQLFGLAAIPGTASVLAGGSVNGTTGGKAVIWAKGRV